MVLHAVVGGRIIKTRDDDEFQPPLLHKSTFIIEKETCIFASLSLRKWLVLVFSSFWKDGFILCSLDWDCVCQWLWYVIDSLTIFSILIACHRKTTFCCWLRKAAIFTGRLLLPIFYSSGEAVASLIPNFSPLSLAKFWVPF
jgi:hypothetical protein